MALDRRDADAAKLQSSPKALDHRYPEAAKLQLDLTDEEAAELQTFLAEKYNSPSAAWLAGLRTQFVALRALLEQGADAPHTGPSNGNNEQTTTPGAARAAALPVVKLFYRNILIGTSESLQCYGVGTMSLSTFEDIFWQKVDEVNNENSDKQLEIYTAQDGSFEFRYGTYMFMLMYYQHEELIRKYPDIRDAPVALVEERAKTDVVYSEISQTQIIRLLYNGLLLSLGTEVITIAYYFLRAHAIERGAFYNLRLRRHDRLYLHTQYILRLLDRAVKKLKAKGTPFTSQRLVAESINEILSVDVGTLLSQCHIGRDLEVERTPPAMIPLSQSVLVRVRALTMDAKMNFPCFVKIDVEYNGSSSISRGVLLAMVEKQIDRLRSNILALLKPPEPNEKSSCVLWPSRLIEASTNSSKINNWVYVLGLKLPGEDSKIRSTIEDTVDVWTVGVASKEEYDQSSCFISASVVDRSAMKCTLINCTQRTRLKAIHGPKRNAIPTDIPEPGQSPEKKKKKKNHEQEHSSSEPTRGLREASDVLSALRHNPTYDIDDFKVGYVDRFKPAIQEKPAADWQSDTQHDEFIAEHRIEYFKKCPQNGESEIWWEKKTKTDKFFHTGNSAAVL